MRHVLTAGLSSAIALALPTPASSATIMITSTSKDNVGQSLVYNLRDQINRSSLHRIVYSRDDAAFIINVVTIEENDGHTAAYSAVLTMPPLDKKGYDYFVSNVVGYCGSSVTDRCATSILSSFDGDMSDIASAITEILKKPK